MSTLNYEFALPFTKIEQELSQNQQESGAAYQSDLHPQNAKFLMCFINVPFIPRLRIGRNCSTIKQCYDDVLFPPNFYSWLVRSYFVRFPQINHAKLLINALWRITISASNLQFIRILCKFVLLRFLHICFVLSEFQ